MAKKNVIVEPELKSVEKVDDETGELITFSPDDENVLLSIEQNITFNYIQMALGLKTIRDRRLYLLRADSMKDYCQEFLRMSYPHMHRYLKIADAFNGKSLEKFSGTPMNLLLEISRNDELLDEANDPESDADDIVKKAREQEKRKFQKKFDKIEEVNRGQEALLTDLREKLEEKDDEIGKLKNSIQTLMNRKDIDPSKVVFITQKKEAFGVIDESMVQVLNCLGTLNGIPHELLDAELSGKLSQCISAIEAGILRLRDFYSSYIVTPADSAELVPGV